MNILLYGSVSLICILTAHVGESMPVAATTGTVFTYYPRELDLSPKETLTLLWKHNIDKADIRWCNWQHRPLGDDAEWTKVIGYDPDTSQQLNITEQYVYYRFVNRDNPCDNGIWSPVTDLQNVVGDYRMMIIALNGSIFTSPAAKVRKQACPVCPPCTDPSTVSTPKCEVCEVCRGCTGPIVAVVFLMLLMAAMCVLAFLYWKGILPEECLKQVHMKPRKYTKPVKPDPTSQRLLVKYEVVDLKEAVTKLEDALARKTDQAEKAQDAHQTQLNRVKQESTYHKQTIEAKEAEIATLEKELKNMREEYDHHQNELIEMKQKVQDAEKRASTMSDKPSHFVRNLGKTLSSFRASKHDDRVKRPSFLKDGSGDWKAVFAEPLKDVILKPGEDLKLAVKVKEEGTETKWFRYDVSLDKSPDVDIQPGVKDSHKVKLKMKKRTVNLPGVYKCTGTYGAISRTVQATVTVAEADNEAPVFVKWPTDTKYATEGNKTDLSVTVRGNPINSPTWLYNGKPIDKIKRHIQVETSTDNTGNRISRLTFDPCGPHDSGDYVVVAENKLGKTKCGAKLAVLDAKSAPEFVRGLRDKAVILGDTVTFSVIVVGSPQPVLEWTNNREFIDEYDHVDVLNTTLDGRLTSQLTIHNVSDTDAGLISVTARNDAGTIFCDANLTVNKT